MEQVRYSALFPSTPTDNTEKVAMFMTLKSAPILCPQAILPAAVAADPTRTHGPCSLTITVWTKPIEAELGAGT